MKRRILLAVIASGILLSGCADMQSAINQVNASMSDLGKTLSAGSASAPTKTPPQPASGSPGQAAATSPALPASIRTTALAGLFTKHPYDGTAKSHFPRVAVTVTNWSRSDCWVAVATIWWNQGKSESVPPFSVCWGQSLGFAVNNAAHMHLFMGQTAFEHSGNVRTTGPKPPMLAFPDRQPMGERQQQQDFPGFIQQLVLDTGWQPGAPTNMWLVGYDANAGGKVTTASDTSKSAPPAISAKARTQLEQALACKSITGFEQAEAALKRVGWPDTTTVLLPEPVNLFGFSTRKVLVFRDGFENMYRSFLPGISLQEAIKAAALKLGKDGKSYGRVTKLGVLTADVVSGETTLTCTVDTEPAYD